MRFALCSANPALQKAEIEVNTPRQAALPTVLPTRDGVPPEEELIRKAARIIAQKRAAFEVHEPAPSDLPRPFQ